MVKLEVEEVTENPELFPSRSKKSKVSANFQNQSWSGAPNMGIVQQAYINPLDEPSPLGLTLRKTPSLLDLIQMKLSQGDSAFPGQDSGKKKDGRPSAASQTGVDKLKASNFPVSILRIGTWECKSRYEGDLVAKCYFAKHKLVWEVLEGGLKSKIEIQWSDITALKATFPENEPATFEIEVSRPPSFFKETNPQPRKHTLWQGTSDFTGGQASICRRHFLQCPHGLLNRHYEKLIQCDPRLNMLSRKPFLSKDSPYFEPRSAVFHDKDEQSYYGKLQNGTANVIQEFDQIKNEYMTTIPCFPDISPALVSKVEPVDTEMRTVEGTSQETPSPSSVMDTRAIEEPGNSDSDELNMRGARHLEPSRLTAPMNGLLQQESDSSLSTAMSNLKDPINLCCQENKHSNCQERDTPKILTNKSVFDEIAQNLLNDTALATAPDEQAVLGRVNSLLSLFQKDLSSTCSADPNNGNGNFNQSGLVTENTSATQKKIFDEIAQTFLSDQSRAASDETSVMARVNSLRCLLQISSDESATEEDSLAAQKKFLDEIAQTLLSDNSLASSDEQSVIARVNSLRCLLQNASSGAHGAAHNRAVKVEECITSYDLDQIVGGGNEEYSDVGEDIDKRQSLSRRADHKSLHVAENEDVVGEFNQLTRLPRKESAGDLLLHLPRIASLPQFFINVSDELPKGNESSARTTIEGS